MTKKDILFVIWSIILCTVMIIAVMDGAEQRNKTKALEKKIQEQEKTITEQQKIIEDKTEEYRKLISPSGNGTQKSYMDYRAITSTSSPQYSLTRNAETDRNGLMHVGDYYLVALGSAYGQKIGTKYKITLSNGRWFRAMLGDQKADCDTDTTRTVADDGSVVEFIINGAYLDNGVRLHGDVSALGAFSGSIESIEVEQ